jgi:glycosyltransferase involved in cell wall biosynthesis
VADGIALGKILRVIGSIDPATGGPLEALVSSAAIMAEQGIINEVVTLDAPNNPWAAKFPLRVFSVGPAYGKYRYTPRLVPWLKENAAAYQIVIVHGLWNYSSIGTWRALRNTGVPYVIFTHGMLDPWFRKAQPVKHLLKQLYWLALEGRALSAAHCILFTTNEECRLARKSFCGHHYRERVVAYGATDVSGDAKIQISSFRARLPALTDRPYILYLGRIHKKKGCDLLIKAFANLCAEYSHVDLVIAGPDSSGWSRELKNIAREAGIASRIHWPGAVSGDEKWGAFRGATAFILPSHQENFGIAVAEAMACSTPVLITNKVNIWREVETGGAGLVGSDDLGGIFRVLKELLTMDTAARKVMAANARATYLAHFDIVACARDLAKITAEVEQQRSYS